MELQELSKEEIRLLENKIVDLKPPQADCFGIKRRICQVCEKDCSGYQSANFMFASTTQQRGEFPTFCKQCSCPAYFHKIIEGQFNFPEDLSSIIKSNNIQSNDINWNCLMSTFMLEKGSKNKIADVIELMKSEGIEVISFTQRYIQAEEAFLLRSRIVDMQLADQNIAFNSDFKKTNKDNEIKGAISLDTFGVSTRGEQNPYLLEKLSQMKENMMKQQLSQAVSSGAARSMGATRVNTQQNAQAPQLTQTGQVRQNTDPTQTQKNENVNQSNIKKQGTARQPNLSMVKEEDEDDFNDRAMGTQRSVSPAPGGLTPNLQRSVHGVDTSAIRAQDVYAELTKKNRLLPTLNLKEPKLRQKQLNEPQAKVSDIHKEIDEKLQIEFLVQCLETNQLLQQLCQNEIVFLILSSAQVQNLSKTVKQLLQKFDNSKGTRMLYFSQNKISALEDCIQFVPHLFRLSKSIMVSEPLAHFTEGVRDRFAKDSYLGRLTEGFDASEGPDVQTRELNPYREKTVVTHYSDRNAVSMQSKLSYINRQTKAVRNTNTATMNASPTKADLSRRNSMDSLDGISQASWVQRAKEQKTNRKETVMGTRDNKLIFNYGIMRDFFNYSGMCVQNFHKQSDLSKPLKPCGIRGGIAGNVAFEMKGPQPCNMFAIAKVGLPNLIMPNTLDLKFSNFENFDSYTNVSDMFFPDISINHQSVIILRPMIVRNQLNSLLVNILTSNEFMILKRKIRPLTGGEVAYLFRQEKVPESNKELYFDLMLQGPSEIIVVSKLSGVYDAKTLLNGSSPFGRRRLNQINEDSANGRTNVDSVSAMFEVAPFTSFTELLDLEDFLGRNSKLAKFKKQNEGQQPHAYLIHKEEETKREISLFSRFFNFAGYCSDNLQIAQNDICVFAPSVATLGEVILVLNPIYNNIVEDAFELIIRQGYQILRHHSVLMTEEQVKTMYAGKLDFETQDGVTFLRQMTHDRCHIFHLLKIAGDRETRQMYIMSDLQLEDLLMPTDFGRPLKPVYIPYIFLFLDTLASFEFGLTLMYKNEHLVFTGRDMFHCSQNDAMQILQLCLLVTVGDTVKVMYTDQLGNVKAHKPNRTDQFEPMNTFSVSGHSRDGKLEPQFIMTTLNDESGKAKHCSYAVESASQGIFEVRFLTVQKDKECIDSLLQRFATLSMFYSEASKVTSNAVPAFYKYKIGGEELNRVYEVEEHMGDKFMQGLSKLHVHHLKIIEMNAKFSVTNVLEANKQKSMPAFVFGTKIGHLCRSLYQIKTKHKGAGKFVYKPTDEDFIGELEKVTDSSYFFYDKERYTRYLENFKKGWHYYLSVLETEIIEMKLAIVLNSLTFRFSRQPEFLKLVPERFTSDHLRVSEKIKIVNKEGLDPETDAKFFKADGFGVLDPKREQEVSSRVESVMMTLKNAMTNRVNDMEKRHNDHSKKPAGTSNTQVFSQDNKQATPQPDVDFSIHNDVAICGFEDGVSRRPHSHLMANIMWIFAFEYKKINRCPQFLVGERDYKFAKNYIETEYDEVIDIILSAALEEYHKNHSEAVDIKKLKEEEGTKTDLQHQVEVKMRVEEAMLKSIQDMVETEKRKARTTMTLQELIKTEIWDSADIAKKQQRDELKQFLAKKGGEDRDGAEFNQFMEKSKMQFGPYATKLAENFVKNQQIKQAMQRNPAFKEQEFISTLKMEYFLFGVSEANHIIQRLRHMEDKINTMNDVYDQRTLEINTVANKLRALPYEPRFIPERKLLTSQHNQMVSDRLTVEEGIFQFRLEISTKEAELLYVFRELMSCDFYVADDHFSKESNILTDFKVPLQNFWRPVEFPERIEKDLNHPSYVKTVGAMENLTEASYGQFISPHIKEILMNQQKTKDKIQQLSKGATTGNLNQVNQVDRPKTLAFERFSSAAEAKMEKDLEIQEAKMKQKATRVEYKPDVAFQ